MSVTVAPVDHMTDAGWQIQSEGYADALDAAVQDGYVIVSHQQRGVARENGQETSPSASTLWHQLTRTRLLAARPVDIQRIASPYHAFETERYDAFATHDLAVVLTQLTSLRGLRASYQERLKQERATSTSHCEGIVSALREILQVLEDDNSSAEGMGPLKLKQAQLHQLKNALAEQMKVIASLETEVVHVECQMTGEESQLDSVLAKLENATEIGKEMTKPQIFDDGEDDGSERSSLAPSIVKRCFDHTQRANNAKERLIEHEATFAEEKSRREAERTQGLEAIPNDADLEHDFEVKRQLLKEQLEATAALAQETRGVCLAEGHDLESYRWRRRSRRSESSLSNSRASLSLHDIALPGPSKDDHQRYDQSEVFRASEYSGINIQAWLINGQDCEELTMSPVVR